MSTKNKKPKRIYDRDGCTQEVSCPECGDGSLKLETYSVTDPNDEWGCEAEGYYYKCNKCSWTCNYQD